MESTTAPPTAAERDFPLGVPGFTYQDLHSEPRLAELDRIFLDELRDQDAPLAERLAAWRGGPGALDPIACSRLLVEAARPLSRFIARLFGVEREWRAQAASAGPEAILFRFRRDFLLRRAVRATPVGDADLPALARHARAIELRLFDGLPWETDPELSTARMGAELLDLEAEHIEAVRQKKRPSVSDVARRRVADLVARATSTGADLPSPRDGSDEAALEFLETLLSRYASWCRERLHRTELSREIARWVSFRLPAPFDFHRLVETERPKPDFPEERVGDRKSVV